MDLKALSKVGKNESALPHEVMAHNSHPAHAPAVMFIHIQDYALDQSLGNHRLLVLHFVLYYLSSAQKRAKGVTETVRETTPAQRKRESGLDMAQMKVKTRKEGGGGWQRVTVGSHGTG